jgi:hypothetical protein
MIIAIVLFLLGCPHKIPHKRVGVIDIIDNGLCAIQFDDTTTIVVKGSKCKGLKEGDTLSIEVTK